MQPVAISDDENDRHTAFHEAAHCVVGYVHGWSLTPDQGVRIGDEPSCWMRYPATDEYSFRHVQHALAGWLAEVILMRPDRDLSRDDDTLLYFLDQVRWDEDDGETTDDHHVFRILLTWFPNASDDDLLRSYRDHEARTLAVLSEPAVWSAIERLAEALILERHISDPEVAFGIIWPALSSEAARQSSMQRGMDALAAPQPTLPNSAR